MVVPSAEYWVIGILWHLCCNQSGSWEPNFRDAPTILCKQTALLNSNF